MAEFGPFEPNVKPATAGFTVVLVAASTSVQSVNSINALTSGFAPSLMITNTGQATAWVRLTTTADATVATTSDTPVMANTVRLFANPSPNGTAGIYVLTGSAAASNTIWATPGQGGNF